MERIKWLKKDNKGELMLESLIVYPITLFLLFFILAIFSVLYQRWNLQTVANDAVARMAQTYRLKTADESTGFISETDLIDVGPYRYLTNAITNNLEETIEKRIDTYAQWRLAKTTYTKNVTNPQCDVDVVPDALGRRHLVLTITGQYTVPFGEALSFFGFDSIIQYETVAYADCVDIIDYINLVDYVDTQTSLKQFGSKMIGLVDAVLSLFDNILDK